MGGKGVGVDRSLWHWNSQSPQKYSICIHIIENTRTQQWHDHCDQHRHICIDVYIYCNTYTGICIKTFSYNLSYKHWHNKKLTQTKLSQKLFQSKTRFLYSMSAEKLTIPQIIFKKIVPPWTNNYISCCLKTASHLYVKLYIHEFSTFRLIDCKFHFTLLHGFVRFTFSEKM